MVHRESLRCAIYTRKSTEEGLDQTFNSLHAQREYCEAYVQSQGGEGWSVVRTRYDDGGFSGASMSRPGLQHLLRDVEAKRIDVVVVYKVDRLTRSLADFARILECLDKQGTAFVSVTQAFNTNSSMGRLTLNILLSFAQFEREVTGERIRDKVQASKAKGMWMGGTVPLGVVVQRRRDTEAALKLLRRLLRNQPVEPESITTDGLASYGAALEQLELRHLHRPGRRKITTVSRTLICRSGDESGSSNGLNPKPQRKDFSPRTRRSTTPSTSSAISSADPHFVAFAPMLIPLGRRLPSEN